MTFNTPRTITQAPPPSRTIYACDRIDQIRLLGDRLLLKPLQWEPSKIIEVVRFGRALRGTVMAVGPGHNPLKYRKIQGKKLMDYSKRFRPTEVRVGDIVELGGLNIFDGKGYEFPEVLVGTERMLICTERDVVMVVEPDGVTVEATFTADDIINAPPLPPPTSDKDPRCVIMRRIEQDVMDALVPRETSS